MQLHPWRKLSTIKHFQHSNMIKFTIVNFYPGLICYQHCTLTCVLTCDMPAPLRNSSIFTWPLLSATSRGVIWGRNQPQQMWHCWLTFRKAKLVHKFFSPGSWLSATFHYFTSAVGSSGWHKQYHSTCLIWLILGVTYSLWLQCWLLKQAITCILVPSRAAEH